MKIGVGVKGRGRLVFVLGGLCCGEPWWGGRIYGGILFFSLWGNDPRFSTLIVSIRLVEHLPEVNITYLLMICNFKDKLWHLFSAR